MEVGPCTVLQVFIYISGGVLQTTEQPGVAGKRDHCLFVSCPVAHDPATPGRHWYVAMCVMAAAATAAADCLLQPQELGCSAEHMQGGLASMSSELNQILLK